MQIGGMLQAAPEFTREQPRLADEVDGPNPVNESDRQFERTAPVHPTPERALLEPRLELLYHRRGIADIAGRAIAIPGGGTAKICVRETEKAQTRTDSLIGMGNEAGPPHLLVIMHRVRP